MNNPELSIIIPIYNENAVLPELLKRLYHTLEAVHLNYEIIFVNDCSSDSSLQILKDAREKDKRIKILSFSRNFGHQTAITAGLRFSSGDAVTILDGDLQDPPELIPKFIEKWKAGFEVVHAVRTRRNDPFLKQIVCKFYYRFLNLLSRTDFHLDSGDCCLMTRRVVNQLNAMPERNRYIRGLRSWLGFKQSEIYYERDRRYAGKSKYDFLKLLKLGLDGIFSFSEIPLRISIIAGFFVSTASLLYSSFIIWDRLTPTENTLPGWTSIVAGMTFLGGVQLVVIGFLGEYIIRIFDEVKGRPMYVLDETLGFKDEDTQTLRHYSSL